MSKKSSVWKYVSCARSCTSIGLTRFFSEPACAGYTYTLRTNRRQSIVNYPQRRITSCGQFEGSFTLIATNGLCIKVTADLGSRDTKSGELIRVHDGDINSRQLFQGSSLRGVNVVSSSYIITVSLVSICCCRQRSATLFKIQI